MTQAAFTWSTDDRSNRARVLQELQDRQGQWVSGNTLRQVGGSRAGARVHELRRDGWLIECAGERGRFNYRLTGRTTVRPPTRRGLARLVELFRGVA